MKLLRRLIKYLLPAPVLRRIKLKNDAHALFENYYGRKVRTVCSTVLATGETHNFTYDLGERNLRYLAETITVATGLASAQIETYVQKGKNDTALRAHVLANHKMPPRDLVSPFGRRLGWYARARAIKPQVIVETGVEHGHGAVILCAALIRNASEGRPGRYFGTDIDPDAGRLLTGPYAAVGKILYGDSIQSLTRLNESIDMFVNDSDHSDDYEYREYHVVASKLSQRAIVLGDNAHVTDKLLMFSRETGRDFLFFPEEPKNHWYPGAGIGISFP
jgi:predicted O-methyltransferase YrrM